uniref:Uncharacterized protein n=1 Tax=Oryza barthii TaxID=65489 RepID=A0A0D3F573_9ORYZ
MVPATQMAAPPPRARGGSFCVLRTARVAPSSPDGVPMLGERTVPLTFLDAIWLPTPPVDRVFFYRLGADDDGVDAVLSRLADSLSRALHVFYPLAGRLRLTPGKTNRYELFYQPGDAVAFTFAEHDDGVGVDELAADDPREVAKIAPLVPELPDGGAVLAVQATVLLPPARRGLALGVTVHHAACDGSSSTHFLHTWAAACAGAVVLPKPPVIDRTFIREREDLYDYMVSRTKEESDKFRSPDVADSKLLATFTLSGEILQSIKDRVAGVAARRGAPLPRCTSIVATFAVRCTEHVGGMSASDGPPLAVAGSPRFRVYDVDFGFGRPAKVDVVSVAKTGAISVAEGRGGGIEVGVGLPPERMERFRRCFADAVAWLSSPSRPVTRDMDRSAPGHSPE